MAVKIILAFLFAIILISLIQYADAALDLQKKQLISDNGDIVIEFGENSIRQIFLEIKTKPNFEFGTIRLVDQEILLDASDNVSVRILGKSIAIKSLDPVVIIYARNVGDNNYSINVYTIDDGFKKQTFTATLETIESEKVVQIEPEAAIPVIEEVATEPLINVLTAHHRKVNVGDPFVFVIKVFDIDKYDGSDWANWYGKLDGVTIHAEVLGLANQVLKTVDGVTENGIFEGRIMVPENAWPKGWYTLSINALYKGDTFYDDLKFFVQSNKAALNTNKAPIANAGPDNPDIGGLPITLDGTASTDPDGFILTYSWSILSEPNEETKPASFNDSTIAEPTLTTQIGGTYVIQLTVHDNRGKSNSDTVELERI